MKNQTLFVNMKVILFKFPAQETIIQEYIIKIR